MKKEEKQDMTLTPATNRQDPNQSIMDFYNKQTYLGNQFVYSIPSSVTAGTSETPLILLTCPLQPASGSFPNAKSVFHNFRKVTCLTATQSAIFRFYLNPTVTGAGTAETALNLRPANANTSIATIGLNPSVSSNGTFIAGLASNAFSANASDILLILDPGQEMLMTVQSSASSTNVEVELGWYQL